MADLKLVVGLGNPGPEYAETRHNLGFKVIEALDEALGIVVKQQKFGARVGEGWYRDRKVMLMKPWQYMNRSGQAVATVAGFYKLGLGDLIVITDDRALAPGRIRIRAKGSAGGHNGLADIIARLGSDEFARCRIGIGDCPGALAVDYVLGRPREDERPLLNEAIVRARDAVLCWLESGTERTMNEFNSGPV
ncbi:aminoacyl-tRNA hydrolase [Anaerobaca lacustris]|uniref:Peptidyl-tRNA hydrolase n=1 Tax=Anaerobaca lacustris TaxID=3044600 RepID=A0AAW6U0D1_9BACT|nr:aminoacyl-tRNA hydrolase [Sedimentisphaerales bacterium M17dextr]